MSLPEYFSAALQYCLDERGWGSQSALAKKIGKRQSYVSALASGNKKGNELVRRLIAKHCGYESYDDFLQLGKHIVHYGRGTVGARRLNLLYERITEIMTALNLNQDQLILKSRINTPKQSAWHFIGDPPDPEDLIKIAYATGYNSEWLISGNGPRIKPEDPQTNGNILEIRHLSVIKRFVNKELALNINENLNEIEKLRPERFNELAIYIKTVADELRATSQEKPTPKGRSSTNSKK